jgi:hypothetical protein
LFSASICNPQRPVIEETIKKTTKTKDAQFKPGKTQHWRCLWPVIPELASIDGTVRTNQRKSTKLSAPLGTDRSMKNEIFLLKIIIKQ